MPPRTEIGRTGRQNVRAAKAETHAYKPLHWAALPCLCPPGQMGACITCRRWSRLVGRVLLRKATALERAA